MSIIRPNLAAGAGERAILRKYLSFEREFALQGAVDLVGETTFTDSVGDEWDLTGSGTATEFVLTSTGLKIARTTAIASGISLPLLDHIPGLGPLDRVACIWRVKDFSLPAAASAVYAAIERNTMHSGGWHVHGGVASANPRLVSQLVAFDTANAEALTDKLLCVECSGLSYGYRKQSSAEDFPEVIPDDIPLFSGTDFAGYYHGKVETLASTTGVSVPGSKATFSVESGGAATSAVLGEFWLYQIK